MNEVRETPTFTAWLSGLRDARAKVKIVARIARVSFGLLGDVKSVGDRVSELRIDFGPGYRVYFTRRGSEIIVLLCGGDKGSQSKDIAKAKELAAALK